MDSENWKKVKALLDEALELSPAERSAFLRRADHAPEIIAEAESLLSFETAAADMMNLSAAEFGSDLLNDEDKDLTGTMIGPFEITGEIGVGGMGAIYRAERRDGKFLQIVALKLLKRELNTADLRRRFAHEREILASLDHPNIARLLEAGTTEDRIPYIAMEFIVGMPLAKYCSQNSLSTAARLRIFQKVCSAVAFAHRNLIVHRDIKPGNILVTADGTPKLLDFGISKIVTDEFDLSSVDAATITKMGVMTPSYAAPEQLRGQSVTTSADIYSLGVVLYELLSGRRPFAPYEGDLHSIYQAVLTYDPPAPSATVPPPLSPFEERTAIDLFNNAPGPDAKTQPAGRDTAPNQDLPNSAELRGDLDNIVLKAISKEPERRYSSAEDLSADIERHLNGLPVTARPNTFSYRAGKFVRRNKLSVIGAGLLFTAIFTGLGTTLWQAQAAKIERQKAEHRFQDVRTLAHSFLFEFSPKIEYLRGATPARQLLVIRGLEYLDKLALESSADLQLQEELAAAYEKVGDVQGNPANAHLGDTQGALESYGKARAIFENLLAASPNNAELKAKLAGNLLTAGLISSYTSNYSQATEFLTRSAAMREDLLANDPGSYQARFDLARAYQTLGLIPFYEGDNDKAIEHYDKASAIFEELVKERPDDVRAGEYAAYAFIQKGEALGWKTELRDGLDSVQKGIVRLKDLNARFPNDAAVSRTLMLGHQKEGELYYDLEEDQSSVEAYKNSIAISERSIGIDANNWQAKRDLALGHKKLGQTYESMKKVDLSIEHLNRAIDIFAELMTADVGFSEAKYDLANARLPLGLSYATKGDHQKAIDTLRAAAEGFTAVMNENPKYQFARRSIALTCNELGKVYLKTGNKIKARQELQKALDMFDQIKAGGNLPEYDQKTIEEISKHLSGLPTLSK